MARTMTGMDNSPSTNGANGRLANGRFAPGNSGGPGNPHGRRVAELRSIILTTVTDDDFKAVVQRLIGLAKSGDLPAIRELLDRLVGRPLNGADLLKEEFDEARLDEEILAKLQKLAEHYERIGYQRGLAAAQRTVEHPATLPEPSPV